MTFLEFARAHGLLVDHIPADGAWHRFKTETNKHKRNGSAKLSIDGGIGWVIDHAKGDGAAEWKRGKDTPAPKIDRAAIEHRRHVERRDAAAALKAAMLYWQTCKPLRGGHPYLASHGLDMAGCMDLRVDPEGWLMVSAVSTSGNIMSFQRISPDGQKRYWPGLPISGARYVLAHSAATITVISEGLATGLAIYQACPAARVIVAFDAGNLAKLEIPLRGLATVAADNDLGTAERLGRNPGIDAAQRLSERTGAGICYPEGIKGTDWCDYRQERRAAGLASRGRFTSEQQVFKQVDEALAREIARSAKFVVRP